MGEVGEMWKGGEKRGSLKGRGGRSWRVRNEEMRRMCE